jgi:hypothetical protein
MLTNASFLHRTGPWDDRWHFELGRPPPFVRGQSEGGVSAQYAGRLSLQRHKVDKGKGPTETGVPHTQYRTKRRAVSGIPGAEYTSVLQWKREYAKLSIECRL